MPKNLQIVTIGGGSGHFVLLSGLKQLANVDISAVVAMSDSGGSSGVLRDKLGVLPPGDILKCLLALSPYGDARDILLTRVEDGALKGHNAGNLLLSAFSNYSGNFPQGVQALGQILKISGQVLPVTTDRCTLVAELDDGSRVFSEAAIDVPRGQNRAKIKNVYLVPHHGDSVSVYPPVLTAIANADFIVIGPGDLFTSIEPNLLVPGVVEALRASHAQLIFLVNIMTKYGETDHYQAIDFVEKLESVLGRVLDVVVLNNAHPPKNSLDKYKDEMSYWVNMPEALDDFLPRRVVGADLLDVGDVLRHSPDKIRTVLEEIFY
ncbi:MAG TPA: YvcK family protein [bacterium]|nr:YvcK family protein [bacterium]